MDINKATKAWENLEYAKFQVRLLKSCCVRVAKEMMINDHVYNICIEEEQPNFFEGKCRCTYNHYAFSNSVTSSESFMEETQWSKKSEEEEGGQGVGEVRWLEEAVGEGKMINHIRQKCRMLRNGMCRLPLARRKVNLVTQMRKK